MARCAVAIVVALSFACASPRSTLTRERPSASHVVRSLRAAGLAMTDAGMVDQPFFAVPAHVYTLADGGDLQVYEFASAADAEAAASTVAPDGFTIGTSKMSWMAAPHFFHRDRVIVNYLGTSSEVLAALEHELGAPFAGR